MSAAQPTTDVEIGPKAPLATPPAAQPSGPVVGKLPEAPAVSAAKGASTVIEAAASSKVTAVEPKSSQVSKPATLKGKGEAAGAAASTSAQTPAKPADTPPKTSAAPAAAGDTVAGPGKAPSLVQSVLSMAGLRAAAASTPATAAKAEPAPKTVPKSSPAAVIMPSEKNITAMERLAETGSVVATGAGSEPAPAAPKAKAKAKATAAIATTATPTTLPQTRSHVAPTSVLNIVSQTPQPAAESVSITQVSAPYTAGVSVGPARAYASAAAGKIAELNGAAGQTESIIPKEGPAAMAVGRAVVGGSEPAIVRAGSGKPRTPIGTKYQIVFVTSEVAPFSKTGGLGEAMDGLPTALAALGHRVMVISPRYDQYKEAWDTGFWSSVTMAGKPMSVHFFHTFKQKVDYVFVDHPTFLERVNGLSGSKLYGPEWGKDFADNQTRFAYFCKAALVAIKELPLGGVAYGQQTMVVANDWHSALVPMFMHAEREADPSQWRDTKTAFLCHNAVFQGRFVLEEGLAEVFGVPEHYIKSITFHMPLKVGKYNKKVWCVNTMAAGLRYSDQALTVSPSYARECCADPEKGVELEELFALGRVMGIVNGVKEGVSPAEKNFVTKTKMLCGTFTPATALQAKEQLKAAYLAENGLLASTGPLMCFIGRLDAQKGYDLLLNALLEVLEDTELQVVVVGAGRADLVAQTKAVEKKYPDKFFYGGWMGPERYAMLAGCDYTLLPSRWEPCGLVQMEAMRMGTLPIVAPTGGLKDTVEDGLNGLWTDAEMTVEAELDEESIRSITKALRRAALIHVATPEKEADMKLAAMAAAAEYTWSNAALQYEAVFKDLNVVDVLPLSQEKSVSLEVDKQVC